MKGRVSVEWNNTVPIYDFRSCETESQISLLHCGMHTHFHKYKNQGSVPDVIILMDNECAVTDRAQTQSLRDAEGSPAV